MRIEILGFKQEKLIENNISLDEALILRTIDDLISSGKTNTFFNEEDGKLYHWIFYKKLVEELPILSISKERMARIINHNLSEKPEDFEKRISECSERTRKDMMSRKYVGLIKSTVVRNASEGTRTYFTFTDKYYQIKEEIFDMTETSIGVDGNVLSDTTETSIGGMTETCYQTRRGRAIRHDGNVEPKIIYIYKYIVEYLNEKTCKSYKHNTEKTQRLIRARLNEGFDLEDFKKVIDTKAEAWLGTDMEKYLRPETLFGTKFEAYLNEAPIRKKVEQEVTKTGINRFKEL